MPPFAWLMQCPNPAGTEPQPGNASRCAAAGAGVGMLPLPGGLCTEWRRASPPKSVDDDADRGGGGGGGGGEALPELVKRSAVAAMAVALKRPFAARAPANVSHGAGAAVPLSAVPPAAWGATVAGPEEAEELGGSEASTVATRPDDVGDPAALLPADAASGPMPLEAELWVATAALTRLAVPPGGAVEGRAGGEDSPVGVGATVGADASTALLGLKLAFACPRLCSSNNLAMLEKFSSDFAKSPRQARISTLNSSTSFSSRPCCSEHRRRIASNCCANSSLAWVAWRSKGPPKGPCKARLSAAWSGEKSPGSDLLDSKSCEHFRLSSCTSHCNSSFSA
mmetsp:Transcript_41906/g.119835  ORF Transcript_41906/g.119835 Transcript_41906/m.119835 type:complete len:339 (+) Transcript_41906:182-1198(+)